MSAASSEILATLGVLSLQIAAITLLTFAVARLLRQRAAAARHAAWSAGLIAIALLPLAAGVLPRLELPAAPPPLLGPASGAHVLGAERPASALPAPAVATSGERSPGETITAPATALRELLPRALLAVWALGAILLLARLGVGLVRVRRLARRSRPWPIGRELGLGECTPRGRSVSIRASEELLTPITFGLRRPVVLVPAGLADWPRDTQRNALRHEYAHVDRLDWGPHLLARLICCVYWFHPFAWLARRELMLEAERACDDDVLRTGVEAPGYAEQLVAWSRRARFGRCADPAVAMSDRRQLLHRIRSILDETQEREPMRPLTTRTLFAAVVLFGILIATLAPASADEPTVGTAPALESPGHQRALTPLMRAAARGDLDEVRRLLDRGSRVDETVRGHGSALIQAASSGHARVVEALLSAGADPDLMERGSGWTREVFRTPLAAAAHSGDRETVVLLLEAGAEVDILAPGDPTPLMVAAGHGYLEIARLLLEEGADPAIAVSGDGNPLIAAARGGELAIVRLLVEAGGDVNDGVAGDGNALIVAVDEGNVEMVRYLLDQGADPRAYVPGDESALVRAAEKGDEELLRLLLAAR